MHARDGKKWRRLLSRPMALALMLSGAAADAAILEVPQQFSTIQAAVDAASPGDTVQVMPGTYFERIVVEKPAIILSGSQSVLSGSNLGGAGIGLHFRGTAEAPFHGIAVSGFTVEGFERGIVLENIVSSRVVSNTLRLNTDKNAEDGAFNNADGLVLVASDFNFIARNLVHDNGHNGIFLISGSSGNVVRGNRVLDNGAQSGDAHAGCGIQLNNGESRFNQLLRNDVRGNSWGILLGPAENPLENLIQSNIIAGNGRAGISVIGPASGNVILRNEVTGNGVSNIEPSLQFDLFETESIDNLWIDNQGIANF